MVGFQLLSQYREVGFMGGKFEHDEVSVGTVEAVVHVSVVVRGAALPANHYLEEDEGGRSVGCRREKWSGTRRGRGVAGIVGKVEGEGSGTRGGGGEESGEGYRERGVVTGGGSGVAGVVGKVQGEGEWHQ